MEVYLEEFKKLLLKEDRSACLERAVSWLREGRVGILDLYERILSPALKQMECLGDGDAKVLWEHISSSIVRTVVENAYPFVLKERDLKYGGRTGKKALVFSPPDEYHDLAARMAADLYTLAGYDVEFLGANTPSGVVLTALERFRPDIIAISVSNFYHITAAEREIKKIRERMGPAQRIVVGGHAFINNKGAANAIGADMSVQTFQEILSMRGGG